MPRYKKISTNPTISSSSDQNCAVAQRPVTPISSRTRSSIAKLSDLSQSTKQTAQVTKKSGQHRPRKAQTAGGVATAHVEGAPCMALYREQPMDVDENRRHHARFAGPSSGDTEDICVVCMCPPDNPKQLEKCGHKFCMECINQCFTKMNPVCPVCGTLYGKMTGNMPDGTMQIYPDRGLILPGYTGCSALVIQYNFPNGIQTDKHPHPGRPYYGTHRVAYLPDNPEGQQVARLLKNAFDAKMTFTVGRSATTGLEDQVIWNDVHHKTRVNGGPTSFGYPDPTYLSRVKQELASKGIL